MLIRVFPDIFSDYPGAIIGVVVAHNVNNSVVQADIKQLKQQAQANLRMHFTPNRLAEHAYIVPWITAYKHFGAKPKKHIPSVLNLGQRALQGSMPSINCLVDMYNIVSLKYLLPAGGEDLDTIVGNIELMKAGQNEKAIILLGDKSPTQPEVGEVIYKDDNGAICRRWNWKEAERTKITPQTSNAIFIIEGLPPVDRNTIEVAINDLAHMIERYCGGTATVAILDELQQQVVLRREGEYVSLSSKKETSSPAYDIYGKAAAAYEPVEHSVQAVASEEYQIRVRKVDELRAQGIEPWPQGNAVNATCNDIIHEFKEDVQSPIYEVSGRVLAIREHGKSIFVQLQDGTGRLQLYFKEDIIGGLSFDLFKRFIDIGDIVWVSGTVFKTRAGEITLKVGNYALHSKCLHPLPEKFHGLADIETKYRQRYLDLIANPESKERFIKRSNIVKEVRNFLDDHNFIEVETPMLHPIAGGATARPFITYHNTLHEDLYLRIAPELYLKRLVIGGMERVYEINRNFRNEGISTRHNPEFTMLEFYAAYLDYHYMMSFVEQMLRTVAQRACQSAILPFGDYVIDFMQPFTRLTMREAVMKYTHCTEYDVSAEGIDTLLAQHAISFERQDTASWGQKLFVLFEKLVESNLIQPTFITEFPVEVSPLAKRNAYDMSIVDRFELFVAGMELSNGFNELNDPFDQAERFKEQAQAHSGGDVEAHRYDADYVRALEYGLPPTVGVGIGIDRLAMLLTNTTSIKDVILFPTLKNK